MYKESTWCEVKLNNSPAGTQRLIQRHDVESMLGQRCVPAVKDKLLIGLVYRSPNSVYENNNQLNAMVSSLGNEKRSHVVVFVLFV